MAVSRNMMLPVATAGVLVLLFACTPRQGLQQQGGGSAGTVCPSVQKEGVDTVAYTITFSDSMRREQFVNSFQSFLDHYQFTRHKKDTVAGQVVIRMLPAAPGQSSTMLSPLEPEWITESTDTGMTALDTTRGDTMTFIDTITPVAGGRLCMHLERNSVDGTFFPLLAAPFTDTAGVSSGPLFTVALASARKVTVTIDRNVTDGSGRPVSALDLIEVCTGYIRQHPAEGLALFRYVDGVMDFIHGKEAVVRGFSASDQFTLAIRLSKSDQHALDRLATDRTLGIYSKLGPYYPVKAVNQEMLCLANRATIPSRQPFLDTLVLNISEDQNPILSFSLHKYDAITLTFTGDVTYAQSTLGKQADLQVISHDRYFLSCICSDTTARKYFASRVNASGLLQNTVKADGTLLSFIESDTDTVVERTVGNPPSPPLGQQFRILFREDDAVSKKIAEKLLADLSGSGLRSSLVGARSTDYERKLLERTYECAVGWTEAAVSSDISEKLRLATMFFNDMESETARIDGYWEVPLFAVNRYLLIRKPAGLYHNAIAGVYASSVPVGDETGR